MATKVLDQNKIELTKIDGEYKTSFINNKTEELYFRIDWATLPISATPVHIKIQLLLPDYYAFLNLSKPELGVTYTPTTISCSASSAPRLKLVGFRLGKVLATLIGSFTQITLSQDDEVINYNSVTISKT